MKKLTLRCYICGKKIEGTIALFSLGTNVDRVFVCHPKDCTDRIDKTAYVLKVERVKK